MLVQAVHGLVRVALDFGMRNFLMEACAIRRMSRFYVIHHSFTAASNGSVTTNRKTSKRKGDQVTGQLLAGRSG
jgi:hypothetical protein